MKTFIGASMAVGDSVFVPLVAKKDMAPEHDMPMEIVSDVFTVRGGTEIRDALHDEFAYKPYLCWLNAQLVGWQMDLFSSNV